MDRNNATPNSPMIEKIHRVIAHYKKYFQIADQQERYKWEAIGWYQQHWDVDAQDFAQMLKTAFSKANNLLASGMYYPYKMITGFASSDPEEVRRIFKVLHDESLPLEYRYQVFRRSCKTYVDQLSRSPAKTYQHYQDLRALMVYLTFQYPEKYYLFKSTMFSEFALRVSYQEEKPKQKSAVWKVESFNRMCNIILEEVRRDPELISMSQRRLDAACYQDEAQHLLAMDIVFHGSNYMTLADFAEASEDSSETVRIPAPQDEGLAPKATDVGLNTILYGPPGTGKTYHTVIYAVAIVENRELASVEQEDYEAVLARYSKYKSQGRIAFTTFHQSYGYEEFIEGIRPTIEQNGQSSDIQYSVQPGIFKRFCEQAEGLASIGTANWGVNASPNIWKVSLQGTGDNPTRSECLKNGHIRIGIYSKDADLVTGNTYSSNVENPFINKMKIGDIVLSCYTATSIDAIGVITGEFEQRREFSDYPLVRKVNWIVKGIREDIQQINGGAAMSLAAVHGLPRMSLSDVYGLIGKYLPAPRTAPAEKQGNYVFIIDEINRGNISKIFGELITLIEPAKRIGKKEALHAVLPYSQKTFGVPGNVYIIGTMNTADRSIAAMDTALRRRFLFREMLPNTKLLENISVEDLSVSDMLNRINKRITALYDRDHTIGHAYFMPLKDSPTIETLAEIFSNSIIPLLQEYFYEDYEKIRLVLGDNQKKNPQERFILDSAYDYGDLFGDADVGLDDGFHYEINHAAFANIEAYRSIL